MRAQILLESVGGVVRKQDSSRPMDVILEPGEVEMVGMLMRDVEVVRYLDLCLQVCREAVIAGKGIPGAVVSGDEPRVAQDRSPGCLN